MALVRQLKALGRFQSRNISYPTSQGVNVQDAASVRICNEKIWEVSDFGFFVDDVINGVGFRPFWFRLLGPGPQPLDGIF